MTLEGFIDSRHPDGLKDLELWLHPALGLSSLDGSNIPHSLDSKPQREQQADGVNIGWILSANMRRADWLCAGVTIPIGMVRNGQVEHLRMEGKGRIRDSTKRRKEGLGINREQFHKLLGKPLQRIKKSKTS